MNEQSLTRGLAFFSFGLGLAELLAPKKVAQLVGVGEEHETLIRALGVREIASGFGILQGRPDIFLWSRVAGDAMDLALLGTALTTVDHDRRRVTTAIAAVAGVTALDILAAVLHRLDAIEPEWRVWRDDRSGIARTDPRTQRAETDAAWESAAAEEDSAVETTSGAVPATSS